MNETQSSNDLPPLFLERLRHIVPAAWWPTCLASFRRRESVGLRVNTLRTSPQAVQQFLADQGIAFQTIPWLDEGLIVPVAYREQIVRGTLLDDGLAYLQNVSSMLAVHLLDPQPDEMVLDLAAAPGGKATHMAARMRNQGWLSVVEPIRPRFHRLRQVLQRGGVAIAHTYLTDGRTVGSKTPGRFDRVLLDAPCSGESRFRLEDAKTWQYWSLRKIREQSRKQKGLLKSALLSTRTGGCLLYATCSYAPEENECVIDNLLRRCRDTVRVVPLAMPVSNWQPGLTEWNAKPLDPQIELARRVLPDGPMDGFFLCKLERQERAF